MAEENEVAFLPVFDKDHPWFDFSKIIARGVNKEVKAKFTERLEKVITHPVHIPGICDWNVLDSIRPLSSRFRNGGEEIENKLRFKCQDYVSKAWERLFQIEEPVYIEATYEFFSTFTYDDEERDSGKVTIRFCLGGEHHCMSVQTFGEYLGLYDDEDIKKDGYYEHFKNCIRDFDYSQLPDMWREMTGKELPTKRAPSWGDIRDPRLKVILAMINLGLIGRKTGLEKAHKDELFVLGCINRRKIVDVARFVAIMMKNVLKGVKPGGVLRFGHLVTKIGKMLGESEVLLEKSTRVNVEMKLFGLTWLKYCKLVTTSYNDLLKETSVSWVRPTRDSTQSQPSTQPSPSVPPQSSHQPSSSQAPRKRSRVETNEAPDRNNDQGNAVPTQGSLALLATQMNSMLNRMEILDNSIQTLRGDIKVGLETKLQKIEDNVEVLKNRINERVTYEDKLLHSLFEHSRLSYTDEKGVHHDFSSQQPPEDTTMPDI